MGACLFLEYCDAMLTHLWYTLVILKETITCPMDGKDCIYSLWFVDDSIATGEGIRIGSSQTEVEAACGAGCFDGNNAYIQNRGNSRLTVILTDGAVSSVRYEWIIE